MYKIVIRRFIARYLGFLIKIVFRLKFWFLKIDKPPIIILTPGKVGSSSVYYTLKKELKNPIFHIHGFSENGILNSIDEHLASDRKSQPLHLIVANLLRHKLQTYQGKLYIITIIREPLSRSVSSFFQNTEFFKSEIEKGDIQIDNTKAKEMLLQQLKSDVSGQLEKWFEEEIEGNFGIDVFEEPFDNHEGFNITRNGRYNHLLIKMECLSEKFPLAIQEFLELEKPIILKNANVAEQKHYSNNYREIKKDLTLDSRYIEEVISSTYFQKFYSSQTESLKQKWKNN